MIYASIYNEKIASGFSVSPKDLLDTTQTYIDYISDVFVSANRVLFLMAAAGVASLSLDSADASSSQRAFKGNCSPF